MKNVLALLALPFLVLGHFANAQCEGKFRTIIDCPTVSFIDESASQSGPIVVWGYDFGDGSTDLVQNPTHTYTANGTYVVCLSVVTNQGCFDTFCDTVVIDCLNENPECDAKFQVNEDCPTVQFTDASTSSGTITSWLYNFGDGNMSSNPNPTYSYSSNGTYVACLTITTDEDCQSTFCDTITIDCIEPPSCAAKFSFKDDQCPNIQFSDASVASPGSVTGWSWDFGDGNTSSMQNPAHTYAANGSYIVCLTIATSNQCQSTFCDTVVIDCIEPASCAAKFSFKDDQCPNIQFSDASVASPGSVTSWSWDFGDGNTSSVQNPAHTYAANGSYVVCLSIVTSDQCQSTFCDTVVIDCIEPASCAAKFSFKDDQCPNIQFSDASVASPGSVTGWSWDFGDGNTSSVQNPAHTYAANGAYIVCLTIATSDQCQSTFCDTVVIDCIEPASCAAKFSFKDDQCPNIQFSDASVASPGSVTSWSWDFGDGNTSSVQNPAHTYAANGSYVVCLSIVTSDQCQSTFCDTVVIDCIEPASCAAKFSFKDDQCPNIQFSDASVASPGSVTGWSWDFGDGNTSSVQNPTHTYAANGSYIVCLTIATSDQCQSTYCDTVVVDCIEDPSCSSAFQYTFSDNCPTAYFYDASSASPGTVTSWSWDFGDGGTSALQNPNHTYTANGAYLVCLTIGTSDGCSNTYCDTLVVDCIENPSCAADFSIKDSQCPNIQFSDASVASLGSITSWSWDFGDGNTSSLQNPAHTYAANGAYLACLTIVTSDSCSSTYCDTVVVDCIEDPSCSSAFQYTFSDNCPTAYFYDASSASPGSVTSWSWDFGDGGTSALQNPNHTYTANGAYLVCLTIGTSDGCSNTYCDTLVVDCIVVPGCEADFQYAEEDCPKFSFTDMSTAVPGTITSWSWDFGDGNTSSVQNPDHTYALNGTYIVCLTIETTDSCTSTFCDTLSLDCIPTPCDADFQFSIEDCPTVAFTDMSTASGGVVTNWNWSFGDGGSSSLQNPTHTYSASGTYVVCLNIVSSAGCQNTTCDTVVIDCDQQPSCDARFLYQEDCPTVSFTDASVSSPNSIASWFYDFGDGNTSTSPNPTHTYTANGTYVVCLSIVTADQCQSTYCDTVVVDCIEESSCAAKFSFKDDQCPNIQFIDASVSSPGTIMGWIWDFGDGNTSSVPNPVHTYGANGTYIACLTIMTSDSCSSTYCDTVVIDCIEDSKCEAFFKHEVVDCPVVSFADASSASPGTVSGWSWDFGDGNTSSTANPTHTYAAPGTYVVCLTITTTDGCSDTYCATVVVDCTLDVEESRRSNLNLFPNPVDDQLTLTTTDQAPLTYTIYSVDGRLIVRAEQVAQQVVRLDVSDFETGVYFIQVEQNGTRHTMRFVKR